MCSVQLLRRFGLHRFRQILQGAACFVLTWKMLQFFLHLGIGVLRSVVLFRWVQSNWSGSAVCCCSTNINHTARHQLRKQKTVLRRHGTDTRSNLCCIYHHESGLCRTIRATWQLKGKFQIFFLIQNNAKIIFLLDWNEYHYDTQHCNDVHYDTQHRNKKSQ